MNLLGGTAFLRNLKQQLLQCPDYKSIQRGWNYPETRIEYRKRNHPSIKRSQNRQKQSKNACDEYLKIFEGAMEKGDEMHGLEEILGDYVLKEVGIPLETYHADTLQSIQKIKNARWTKASLEAFINAEAIHFMRALFEVSTICCYC